MNIRRACTVPLLAAALTVGIGLSKATAAPLDALAFASEIEGQKLAVSVGGFELESRIFADGTVDLQGPLGSFTGHWYATADLFCLTFESGPATGDTCVTISRHPAGGFLTSNGRHIRALAGS